MAKDVGSTLASDQAMREALTGVGGQVEPLSLDQTARLQDRWRAVFAGGVTDVCLATSKGGFDWHVFSFKRAFALVGDAAVSAYANCVGGSYWILLHGRKPGLACHSETLPGFPLHGRDIYVVANDFKWTMVYTHETDFGPYFTTRHWVLAGGPEERADKRLAQPSRNAKAGERRGSRSRKA